jgi:putative PIN family toxin of toxin-antitoxin system
MRVVLDTNVIIAAFAARGLCADVFEVCLESQNIIISKHILSEVERNLIKKIRLPKNIVRDLIDYLGDVTEIVEPENLDESVCRDKSDIPVIGTAISGKARFIITGDKELLSLKKFRKIAIVTPRDFWKYLKK